MTVYIIEGGVLTAKNATAYVFYNGSWHAATPNIYCTSGGTTGWHPCS